MSQFLLGLTLCCALLGNAVTAKPQSAPAPSGHIVHTIDGHEHPELIPAELAWETAFNSIWAFASNPGDTATPKGIAALSKYELHIPVEQVKIVVTNAKQTLDRVRALRADFEREHTSGKDLGWNLEKRRSRQAEIGDAIIDGRDQLVYDLPRESFLAVRRWVAKKVVPGIKVNLYDSGKEGGGSLR